MHMLVILKKGTPLRKVIRKINALFHPGKKGFNASKYCGSLNESIDPLRYQNTSRNEWGKTAGWYQHPDISFTGQSWNPGPIGWEIHFDFVRYRIGIALHPASFQSGTRHNWRIDWGLQGDWYSGRGKMEVCRNTEDFQIETSRFHYSGIVHLCGMPALHSR